MYVKALNQCTLITACLIFLSACGSTSHRHNTSSQLISASDNSDLSAPSDITFLLTIANYKVADFRLETSIHPYSLSRTDKLTDGVSVFYKFESLHSSNYYWLLEVPIVRNGAMRRTAKRYEKSIYSSKNYSKRPKLINLNIVIKNKTITSHRIESLSPEKTKLRVKHVNKRSDGVRIVAIKSLIFKDEIWLCELPKASDGAYKISCPIQ